MAESKRLFAAVKIYPSDEFLVVYNQIKYLLRNERINWVNPDNMHLTIKFFGKTFIHQIPAIDQCLKSAVVPTRTFDIEIFNTGVFGSKYQPRVIWFGIKDGNALQDLFQNVAESLKKIDIFPDRQNFVPHLTIGRIKEIGDRKLFQQVMDKYHEHNSGRQSIDEMILYESILQRERPLYIPIHVYRFGAI